MLTWFSSLPLCLAVAPLAVYLLVVGWLNLRNRVTVLSGFADTMLLGFAVSGLVLVGPVELFFPEAAAFRMGGWVWVLLCALYCLFVALVALAQRPRLIVFNAPLAELLTPIEQAACELDSSAERVGQSVHIPTVDLQLHASPSPLFRIVQVDSLGEEHHLPSWLAFRRALVAACRGLEPHPHRRGYVLVGIASMLLVLLAALSITDQQEIARAFGEMLRRE